jgi:cytochrome b561
MAEGLAKPTNPWPLLALAGGSTGPVVMLRNTRMNWGSVSRLFHWILALLILGVIGFGWWMNHIPARADRFFYRSIHADIGYVILLLTAIRLIWRWINPIPALPATPRWQRMAARVSHGALYGVTMVVALLGWAHSGAHKPDYADWFGLFRVPQLTRPDKAAAAFYEDQHILFAYVLLALIAIHALAAIWHHFMKGDAVMRRMIDGAPVSRTPNGI